MHNPVDQFSKGEAIGKLESMLRVISWASFGSGWKDLLIALGQLRGIGSTSACGDIPRPSEAALQDIFSRMQGWPDIAQAICHNPTNQHLRIADVFDL